MSHYGTVITALDVAKAHGSQRQAAEFMLEAIVDRLGFDGTLELLADIAQAKADHWTSQGLPGDWDTSHKFEQLANRLSDLAGNASPE